MIELDECKTLYEKASELLEGSHECIAPLFTRRCLREDGSDCDVACCRAGITGGYVECIDCKAMCKGMMRAIRKEYGDD